MIRGLLIAVFLNISLGIIGSFLVLRRMALMGDAVAHSVLPGIVIAFLISNSRASLPLLLGATGIGFSTTFLINGIRMKSKVKEDAAMGIVFTTMFALGVVLLNSFAGNVDLDPDCVLYGDLLGVPTMTVWVMATITALVIGGVTLFYKELQVTAFDGLFATGVGISSSWTHYIFMAVLAAVLVIAFEAVGSILVVAMLIAPGATAYLWTDPCWEPSAVSSGYTCQSG
jgi:manganese/zinc/iron transport system permease protein